MDGDLHGDARVTALSSTPTDLRPPDADRRGWQPLETWGDGMARAAWMFAWATWGCLALGSGVYFVLLGTVATTAPCHGVCWSTETYYPAWAAALWESVLLDVPALLCVIALVAAAVAGAMRARSRVGIEFRHRLTAVVTTALTGGFVMVILAFGITGWSGDQLSGWPWAA